MAITHPKRRRRGVLDSTANGTNPGGPTIDPTENVKALSEALSDRQDDLRELNNKYLDAKLTAIENLAVIRAEHQKEMRESESKRIDAIRATDVAAVSTTAAQSLAAIQALASTATTTAETLRNQVTTTATTIANQTDRIVSPIMERIAALEKTANIGQGRSAMSDPAMADLVLEMRKLTTAGAQNTGKSEGISDTMKMILTIGGLLIAFLAYETRSQTPIAPQVIMVPAPVIASPTQTTTTTQPAVPIR
jgi:hypothetical protein